MQVLALAPLAAVLLASPAAAQQIPASSPVGACPAIGSTVAAGPPTAATSGGYVDLPVTAGGPSATYTVTLTRQTPAPAAAVRTVVAGKGVTTTFTFLLGETHRFTVTGASTEPCYRDQTPTTDVIVPVRAAVTIVAARTGPRDYRFTGRVQPAAGTVSLYRLDDDGRRVLTARTAVAPDGTWRVDRRFTGTGRFGFAAEADTGSTPRHAGGTSPARPTVIH